MLFENLPTGEKVGKLLGLLLELIEFSDIEYNGVSILGIVGLTFASFLAIFIPISGTFSFLTDSTIDFLVLILISDDINNKF